MGLLMKKSALSVALEIKDIKALRYINKRERAQKEVLIRKFGEYRIGLLSETTQERPALIHEECEEIPPTWPAGWGPDTDYRPLGTYILTHEGINTLENANAKAWREWIKFYIPISIATLSLIVALISLLHN